MSEDLRRALDRAAGEDPHVDLAETVWARGRVLRRRRHAAQAVGGGVAAAALVGAFFLGGGLFDPQADVGPALPTIQESANATVPVPTTEESAGPTGDTVVPTTEESAGPTDERTPDVPSGPDELVLTSGSIGGVPLTAPAVELVEAISVQFGEPFNAQVDVVGGCSGEEIYSLYNWDGFLLHVQGADGPDAHRSWETTSAEVALPQGVRIGMTLDEVRAQDTVTELASVASPHYQLGSGIVVSTTDGIVVNAQSERGEVC